MTDKTVALSGDGKIGNNKEIYCFALHKGGASGMIAYKGLCSHGELLLTQRYKIVDTINQT